MSASLFTAAHRQLLPQIDASTWSRLDRAASSLLEWNEKINVVSRKDVDSIVERHYFPALALLNADPAWCEGGRRVLDAGCGGGFPGLPLAIACPSIDFTLADGRGKKIFVVNECKEAAEVSNVRTVHGRVPDAVDGPFDVVVGRAVAALPTFLRTVEPVLADDGGVWYIKGGDFTDELRALGDLRPTRNLAVSALLQDRIPSDKRLLFFPTDAIQYHFRRRPPQNPPPRRR